MKFRTLLFTNGLQVNYASVAKMYVVVRNYSENLAAFDSLQEAVAYVTSLGGVQKGGN